MIDNIVIRGACSHNLKNINLEIPSRKLTVVTGVSGSGKSTLAFDTIYAEGQRRYVESLSSYARQFLGRMDKPEVDYIEGLSPAISIDQKGNSRNPRSTVGTITEIYDYYRLLFARIGDPYCCKCSRPIASMTVAEMTDNILSSFRNGDKIMILAPIVRNKSGEFSKAIGKIFKKGYSRLRIDGSIFDSEEDIEINKNKRHSIDIVVDRLISGKSSPKRISDSLETALSESGGLAVVASEDKEILYSENLSCPDCDISLPKMEPSFFSFNSPMGACKICGGIGFTMEVDPELVVPDKTISIRRGAIAPWGEYSEGSSGFNSRSGSFWSKFTALAESLGIDLDEPFDKLSDKLKKIILFGNGGKTIYTDNIDSFEGCVPHLVRRYRETDSDFIREYVEKFMMTLECSACKGKRLRDEALSVKVAGLNISELTEQNVDASISFFEALELSSKKAAIAAPILKEIKTRLAFLKSVGLDYLTLDRAAFTLSGGEAQRIRLASQIGSGLTGVLYVLDEPSVGLHQRDNAKLIETMRALRDLGNTVIVVEHDEDMIRAADYIVDMGPGAGVNGGRITGRGSVSDIENNPDSLTGNYLSGKRKIPVPSYRRHFSGRFIEILGASENNLKNIDVRIPVGGGIICVTGVSGSGKSTLVNDVLYKGMAKRLKKIGVRPGKCRDILGLENFDKVIVIDQSPIGRTPRSNPLTYTGAFSYIRELFASTREAKMYGYKPGRFSFNVKGGRCEACQGDGIIKIEMHFLPDVYVKCEECMGKRYNPMTLEVKFKHKTIADILDLTIDEALEFFEEFPAIRKKLSYLSQVGLGYMKTGQNSATLSGGEAQRIKLACELSKKASGKTLYILDEPTTGLHFDDVARLLNILGRLADGGNTLIVIEHNMEVIKCADYIIDLGPEGGEGGGRVIAEGLPEEIISCSASYTGKFLRKYL